MGHSQSDSLDASTGETAMTKFDEGNLMPVTTESGELVHKHKTDYRDLHFKFAKEAEATGCCAGCGEMLSEELSPNIEAFEISGQILCDDCSEEVFEDNGQFGAGA